MTTSDLVSVNQTVVGIQNNAVSAAVPSTNQVLKWNGVVWIPSNSGLSSQIFTSNGTWVCPDNITTAMFIGFGGGGGGGGADVTSAGGGGGGSIQSTQSSTVIPGTSYTITIGTGGSGGTSNSDGSDGSSTTVITGSSVIFSALGGGKGASGTLSWGGLPFATGGAFYNTASQSGTSTIVPQPGCGAPAYANIGVFTITSGFSNLVGGFSGGTSGTISGGFGGGGGGAGAGGTGGNGGNGNNSSGPGNPGSSAAANSGAGGGGAGQNTGSGAIASGGAGGSGYLCIVY
jgi:glycine rich protein